MAKHRWGPTVAGGAMSDGRHWVGRICEGCGIVGRFVGTTTVDWATSFLGTWSGGGPLPMCTAAAPKASTPTGSLREELAAARAAAGDAEERAAHAALAQQAAEARVKALEPECVELRGRVRALEEALAPGALSADGLLAEARRMRDAAYLRDWCDLVEARAARAESGR